MSFRATVISKCREYPDQIDIRLTSATAFCRLRKGPQRVLRRLSHCTSDVSTGRGPAAQEDTSVVSHDIRLVKRLAGHRSLSERRIRGALACLPNRVP